MGHTSDERNVIFNRLNNNIYKLIETISRLEENEKKSLFMYLKITLMYGLANCVENSYTFNKRGFAKQDIGTNNKISIKNTLDSLDKEPVMSVSIVHNHPDSILPSNDDFETFFRRRILKHTAICGNIGNLYFMQKGLEFHDLVKNENMTELLDRLKKLFLEKTQTYIRECGETVKGLREKPENIRNDYFRKITDIVYCDMCRLIQNYDVEFQFYSEGVALND